MRRTAVAVLIPALFAIHAHAAESTRTLPGFIAINAKGAFAMKVEVGKTQSVVVSGEDKFVAALKTEVVDNELQLILPEKQFNNSKGAPTITITMPSLSRVKVEGAGETLLHKVNSDRLDISYLGAGHLAADGKVKYLRLNAKGVGEVDTSKLRAERVDVQFEGVGNVSVYASELLNAVAKGIGGLTYYGKPKTVNKDVSGIGNVRAGD
ncbi:GIN domain-containing protein [Duganella sp. BuS-21]|uniref:GIN domain-containing protein n=1 Tax=Duganella sp. BuS-21 TaxID=2943848 RepID=UPI0035A5B986